MEAKQETIDNLKEEEFLEMVEAPEYQKGKGEMEILEDD